MLKTTALHKKFWKVFSEYIRLRDCLETTGTAEEGTCCTCHKRYPLKQLQAGHFISRTHKSIVYDERNVHAQCVGCNMFKAGNIPEYWLFMEGKYGRGVIDELLNLKSQTRKFKAYELEGMIDEYKAKITTLKS
jgi:Bacteriophage Lambda NinG protein